MSDDRAGKGVIIVYVNMPSKGPGEPSPGPIVHVSVGGNGSVQERAAATGNDRGRNWLTTTAVAVVVAIVVGVASQALVRSGTAGAAGGHRVTTAPAAPDPLASTLAGAAASTRPPAAPAGVAETVVHDLSLPPRVTPAPGAAAGPSGPSAFGFHP